jgi:Zn-dependent peptidase ImmA (M78 family)
MARLKTPRESETALVFAAALLMQDVVYNKALDRPARDKIRSAALTLKEMADEIKEDTANGN